MELVVFEVLWFGVILGVIWLASRRARRELQD
jgi:hypothetical protein